MPNGIMLTDTLQGYSGLLYDTKNSATPLLNSMIGRDVVVQNREFILGQDYESEDGTIPEISEKSSLTAPTPSFVDTNQKKNVTMIFHETIGASYRKLSNVNQLTGLNIAGQQPNPVDVEDFQIQQKMKKIAKQVENAFFNSVYNLATDNTKIDKTRGLADAVKTNIKAAEGAQLDMWLVNEVMDKIFNKNGDISKLTLVVNGTGLNQINGSAIENGLTIAPATRNENGIQIRKLVMPLGEVDIMLDPYVAAGTAFLLNLDALRPVHQPVPGKGNFFVEELAKDGASNKKQIYGQLGLDYANELLHGQITGLSTTFTKPIGRKVVTVAQA